MTKKIIDQSVLDKKEINDSWDSKFSKLEKDLKKTLGGNLDLDIGIENINKKSIKLKNNYSKNSFDCIRDDFSLSSPEYSDFSKESVYFSCLKLFVGAGLIGVLGYVSYLSFSPISEIEINSERKVLFCYDIKYTKPINPKRGPEYTLEEMTSHIEINSLNCNN